ncbi:hypothetical protein ACFWGN_16245 [Oerskovia sp. NPDC060338]|uniref:hypothetical protein n=1 Tax=Oerskovia sp. NPDC060338 TaxID=3347100 RepID=UPI0036595F05
MSKILTTPAEAVVGQKVRVDDARKTWTVQAVSENFTALVHDASIILETRCGDFRLRVSRLRGAAA